MDVRVEKDKGGIKVRMESDEIAVNLNSKHVMKRASQATRLKAEFEERVSLIRANPASCAMKEVLPFPEIKPLECPDFSKQHPLLQTLLRLFFEVHAERYQLFATAFRATLDMKIQNTWKIVLLSRHMDLSEKELSTAMNKQCIERLKKEFRETWSERLAHVQELLGTEETNLDELLRLAIQNSAQEISVNMEISSLEGIYAGSQATYDLLWKQWNLHMERHKRVFSGKLNQLAPLDEEIQLVEQKLQEMKRVATPSVSEFDLPSREAVMTQLIEEIMTMKLDFDMRVSAIGKLKEVVSSAMNASKTAAIASSSMSILKAEEAALVERKGEIEARIRGLEEQEKKVVKEMTMACNSSLAPVQTYLTLIRASYDMGLESGRETLYSFALDLMQNRVDDNKTSSRT